MTASPLGPLTEDISTGFDKFQPEGAADMIGFFQELPEVWEALAGALGSLAGRMEDEMPLHPAMAEAIREMAGTVAGLRDAAQETNGQFRSLHSKEIERVEEPRIEEHLWDVKD